MNVRQGAGTGYAAVGKLLPGTTVQILELANGGKWGRTDKGWVCMDYITMVSYNPASSTTTADPSKGTAVDNLDKVDKTTTTAVYTGKIINTDGVTVFKEPINYDPSEVDAIAENTVRTLSNGAAVTIHELAEVTRTIKSDEDSFGRRQDLYHHYFRHLLGPYQRRLDHRPRVQHPADRSGREGAHPHRRGYP